MSAYDRYASTRLFQNAAQVALAACEKLQCDSRSSSDVLDGISRTRELSKRKCWL
jgi:hypothetical protein